MKNKMKEARPGAHWWWSPCLHTWPDEREAACSLVCGSRKRRQWGVQVGIMVKKCISPGFATLYNLYWSDNYCTLPNTNI